SDRFLVSRVDRWNPDASCGTCSLFCSGALGLVGAGVTGSDGGDSVGCGGTTSGFSTTVVVSGGGGGGGGLAAVWAKAAVADEARTSASVRYASRRPLIPPSHMNGRRLAYRTLALVLASSA